MEQHSNGTVKEGYDLVAIEELASLCFSPLEIAIIIDVEPVAFLQDYGYTPEQIRREKLSANSSEIYRATMRGRLKQEYQVRRSIFALAVEGSSPAQQQVLRIIEHTSIKDQLK